MSQVGLTEILREPSEQEAQEPDTSVLGQFISAITNVVMPQHKELITLLRIPTPIKVSRIFKVDTHGHIGGGFTNPDPEEVYRCPVSGEAWLHRITVYSQEYSPLDPLDEGELLCTGTTSGEIIFYLPEQPDQKQIAPMQPVLEGRQSAPHLNPGEVVQLVGQSLPVGKHIRIDLQLNFVTGISEYTPRTEAPTNLNAPPTVSPNVS